MPDSLPITEIIIDRSTSRHDDIEPDRTYLARIHGSWFFGSFNVQWYGWNFVNWGSSGIQLNHIEQVFELDIACLNAT